MCVLAVFIFSRGKKCHICFGTAHRLLRLKKKKCGDWRVHRFKVKMDSWFVSWAIAEHLFLKTRQQFSSFFRLELPSLLSRLRKTIIWVKITNTASVATELLYMGWVVQSLRQDLKFKQLLRSLLTTQRLANSATKATLRNAFKCFILCTHFE